MLARPPRHTFRGQTSFRRLCALRSAQRLVSRPACIPIGRPRGVKAKGLRYERVVGRALLSRFGDTSGLSLGTWFEYYDTNGRGYAQVDVLFYDVASDIHFVCECKLTDTPSARIQLDELYLPVVQRALGGEVRGIVIARNLTPATRDEVCESFQDAVRAAKAGRKALWHYLGKGFVP